MITRSVLCVALGTMLLFSCKKKDETPVTPTVDKPRVSTTWTYLYKTFDGMGVVSTTTTITVKATAEQTLGGEAWLSIDSAGTTNMYKLKVKSDGLYQYANSAANLFCKDPAAVNDSYSTYSDGGPETITVKGTSISLTVPYDPVTVNYYEGVKAGNITEKLWYNSNLWLVKRETFAPNLMGMWFIKKRWELVDITY